MKNERFIGPYVYVGYHCNNDCIFCSEYDEYIGMDGYKPLSMIKEEILLVRERYNFINIMGREPTLRKDLFEILDFMGGLDFEQAGMTTNGRLFSYSRFARAVMEKGLDQIAVSISGSNAKTHDRQTKVAGSFDQTVKGMENIVKLRTEELSFLVNLTLNKLNLSELKGMLDLLTSLGVEEINILNIAPVSIRSRSRELIADMREAGLQIKKVLGNAERDYPGTKIWLVEFLPCALPPGLRERFSPCLEKNPKKVRIPICGKCPYAGDCDGVLEDYIHLYGVDGLELPS